MMTTAVKVLSDGLIKFDGGTMFGQVPKVSWEDKVSTDRKNRITLGLNCLLVQIAGKNVLVDAGAGSKELDSREGDLRTCSQPADEGTQGPGAFAEGDRRRGPHSSALRPLRRLHPAGPCRKSGADLSQGQVFCSECLLGRSVQPQREVPGAKPQRGLSPHRRKGTARASGWGFGDLSWASPSR